jgi:hypothetical protein
LQHWRTSSCGPDAILEAPCAEGFKHGVGAQRTCRLTGGITIRERWLAWDEGRSFTYEGVGLPLVSRARNTWTVRAEGDQSVLTSEAEVVLRGGRLGRLLEPLVARQARRMGARSLAAFKYLVEQGEPRPCATPSCLMRRAKPQGTP